MRLYNTLRGAIEELAPLTPGHVGIYACGVTPYSESHVGHAMSAIVYDILVRYLRWPGNPAGGYDVTYVSNYTDVDDKLIDRGRELGVDPLALADQNIALWEEQQRALNLTFPDVRPRVTTHIAPIVALTERLIASGHAYATPSGDVYFRVRSDDDYGKLSHRNIEELRSGTRFEPGDEKEFPLDFALWKAAKPGEPSWDSPWGPGRPGWHIECSAMSQQYLGDTLDIHGGGLDLVFPHHENEVAQSESATGKPFARIWMHSGLVQRDGEKMSKSIGNVVNVSEALQRWSPDALRLFVLTSHYRSPNNLTDEAMSAAERGVERLLGALRPAEAGAPSTPDTSEERARFVAAMEDDLNTAQAMAALFELVRNLNSARDAGDDVTGSQAALRELTSVLGLRLEERRIGGIPSGEAFGTPVVTTSADVATYLRLLNREIDGFLRNARAAGYSRDESRMADRPEHEAVEELRHLMRDLLDLRKERRLERDYAEADRIRDFLLKVGITVEDRADESDWSLRIPDH